MATVSGNAVRKIVVACDAGMGSSVMLASQLRRQLDKHHVTVEHTPVNSIPTDADIVVVHRGLIDRARVSAPDKVIIGVQVFIGDPAVAKIVDTIRKGGEISD